MTKAPRIAVAVATVLLLTAAPVARSATGDDPAQLLRAGVELAARGRFAEAVEALTAAERRYAETDDTARRIEAVRRLAAAEQSLGAHERAIERLERALAQTAADGALRTVLTAQLGGAYLQAGDTQRALPLLTAALEAARAMPDDALAGAVLNDLGALHDREQAPERALDAYQQALRLAQTTGDAALTLRASFNAAKISLERGDDEGAHRLALAARQAAESLETSHAKVQGLLRAGQTLLEIARRNSGARAQAIEQAHASLHAALQLARELGDPRLLSAAQGSRGAAYQLAGRLEEALTLTRAAIHAAQAAHANELLFYWHWQSGRIFRRLGDQSEQALAAYRRAFSVYQSGAAVPLPAASLFVSEPATAAFLELADLLLQRSGTTREAAAVQSQLREARDVIEALKARELQDYFRDSCVAEARARVQTLEQAIDPGTAVLYPIVLPDRLELLLSHGHEIARVSVAVSADTLQDSALKFRAELERQRTLRYLPHAQTLYDWLIRPLDETLTARGITTLVTVPDYALRAVPMAALHDGERFLIERFAVAMVPGLELTDPRPLPQRSTRTLLAGLTEPVHGFPALAHVESELQSVSAYYPGRVLVDDAFQRARLGSELTGERYAIAHIASHGEFSGDARKSFVLAHDGKITLDELSRHIGVNRLRDDPLDLLTLSACHTAAGDERAALGLAGMAVKAGARSVVAALWPIHDEATALLMAEMYRQLREAGAPKAVALQRAQAKLIGITRYRHPGYWSAFVLVGNWR